MSFHVRPISFKPPRLNGLSARLIASHYENNYGGAVRRLNAIRSELSALDPVTAPGFRLNGLKREELIATNSMLLHEIYFENLGEAGGGDPSGALADSIVRDFGSLARWRAEFVAMGKALGGGSGWVLLTRSPRDGTLSNVWAADHMHGLAGGTPLLALDMYEHAYHIDFGSNAAAYVDAFMANIALAARRCPLRGHSCGTEAAHGPDNRRTKMLEADPNLIVIDARLADDAASVPVRLHGARRAPPDKVDEIAASCPTAPRRSSIAPGASRSAATVRPKLREHGIDAVTVAGGIGTWRADGLPTEPLKEGEQT